MASLNLELDKWYSPAEALEIFNSQPESYDRNSVVVARRAKKLREAWILAQICTAIDGSRLMLHSDETFDGRYEVERKVRFVEISEWNAR